VSFLYVRFSPPPFSECYGLLLLLFTAIKFSLGGSSPYTSNK
jgi:hypothetical protein